MNQAIESPAARSFIAELCERWIEIGLCTKPADRASAERAIHRLYRVAGLTAPRVVWCTSPLSLALTRSFALHGWPLDWLSTPVPRGVRTSIHATVERSRVTNAGASVGDSIVDSVKHSAWGAAWRSSTEAAREFWNPVQPIAAAVAQTVGAPIGFAVARAVSSVGKPFCGQHEADWFAALEFVLWMSRRRGETGSIDCLTTLVRSAGWMVPHAGVCWIAERHDRIRCDERGRLHDVTGPAIAYPDGWALHFWHGVAVPPEWIERSDRIDVALALTWPNLEQRRALSEIIGWERVLERVPTRVVHQDRDPSIGALLECTLPGGERCRFLRVRCGTGRTFVLSVPRACQTAREANAWTYGLQPAEYMPEVRT